MPYWGPIMRMAVIALLVTGTILVAGNIVFPSAAWTQSAPIPPVTQDASAKPIGKVVSLKGQATIEHVNAVVVQATLGSLPGGAKVGDSVYLGDIVQTGPDGHVGIAFADGTAFDLSTNARMVLNEFVYNPNSKSNSTFFSLEKGTFTFVAGKIASTGDMRIDTPVATMGIRGTTPHVEISADGTVRFSTLIEKGKNKILEKSGAVSVKPHDGGAPRNPRTFKERNKLNLKICNGC